MGDSPQDSGATSPELQARALRDALLRSKALGGLAEDRESAIDEAVERTLRLYGDLAFEEMVRVAFVIARRVAIDLGRQRASRPEIAGVPEVVARRVDRQPGPSASMEAEERSAALREAMLGALDDSERALIVGVVLEGRTIASVSERLGIPQRQGYRLFAKAMNFLRRALSES